MARFTPTYVGNTNAITIITPGFTVHPHIRGEYEVSRLNLISLTGSLPHTWGILYGLTPLIYCQRFTPTYVGNTRPCVLRICTALVHPHIRGEYPLNLFNFPIYYGSPPHTWGIRHSSLHRHDFHAVHPHIRGEYSHLGYAGSISVGSPPHTWGIRSAFVNWS